VARFHLTENGPKPCNASVRDCPIGGTHFSDKEEATIAYEFSSAKKHGLFGSLKKKSDPHFQHVTSAEKRLRALEPELKMRDERQEGGTLYHELLADGITEAELDSRFSEDPGHRHAGISYIANPSGSKAVGISYSGDFKSEEETGISHISKALKAGELGPNDVQVYEKGDYTVFAVRGERAYGWEDEGDRNLKDRVEKEALSRYENWSSNANWDLKWKLRNLGGDELKARLTGKVKPMPKTKAAMINKIIELEGEASERHPAIGEFQTGQALVVVTKDPLEAKLMKKMKASHEAGYLRVGGSSNPFSNGNLFYDERDLTREFKTDLVKSEEANKYAKAYVSDTRAKLGESGHVYAVSPDVQEPDGDIRNSRFWLNYSPKNGKQIFGWFNKTQLERIASGDLSDVKER